MNKTLTDGVSVSCSFPIFLSVPPPRGNVIYFTCVFVPRHLIFGLSIFGLCNYQKLFNEKIYRKVRLSATICVALLFTCFIIIVACKTYIDIIPICTWKIEPFSNHNWHNIKSVIKSQKIIKHQINCQIQYKSDGIIWWFEVV